ncbi:hypothetical protein LZC95_10195 [Pendulispora brunnea]|uniref:Uncharacterized protein n=1 Tax=Pendulispora brunnea TaxID=2905690 RepID=A0ABZ2KGK2_9BACT
MRFSSIHGSLFVLALGAIATAACGISSGDERTDDSDPSEQATVVKPDGSDLPGKLKVVAPTGAPADTQISFEGNTTLQGGLGQEIGPLSVGLHRTFIKRPDGILGTEANFQILSNQVTTIHTGLLAIDLVHAPPTLGLSAIKRSNSRVIYFWAPGGRQLPVDLDGTKYEALFPNSYYLEYGLWDGQDVTLAGDETKVAKAWDYAGRRVAKIVAPVREYPTATCAQAGSGDVVPLYTLYAPGKGTNPFVLTDGQSLEAGLSAKNASRTYELAISGVASRVALPVGALGAGPLTFQVGRLDVEDVSVKQSDGSVKMVRGDYTVYAKTGTSSSGQDVFSSSNSLNCTPATHSGVDLPRGRYKVVVRYSTVEVGTKTDTIVVDVE